MEPTAAWGRHLEFQLAATNWPTAEEAPAACDAHSWAAPAGGLPLEYASIVDIFGSSSCSLQPYAVPASSSSSSQWPQQQQLVEYNYYNYYAAAIQHHDPTAKAATTTPEDLSSFDKHVEELLLKRKNEFNDDRDEELMKTKMHRYPPSILDLGDGCTLPKVVAIGPYHRHHDKLKPAENLKHVAAHHCIKRSGLSVRQMYHAVIFAAVEIDARGLYDRDVMEGIDDENDFLPMMFYDACFLVMYMLRRSFQKNYDAVLFDFFESNDTDITHDIMLLENQIPWPVVDAISKKMKSGKFLEEFITNWKDGCLLDRVADVVSSPPVELDEDYRPPHLLGLLRFYTVGRGTRKSNRFRVPPSDLEKMKSIQISASAIELAEMGIDLTANETRELPDMGLARKWIIFAELSMAPLSLDDLRASLLVNMAALELCTTPDFLDPEEKDPKFEETAVCSYLLLLCMLMHKEEDVHELRAKGILQGAGLTNKKALNFFTSLHSLRKGRYYSHVMVQIQNYKNKRPWITVYSILYRNWKIISGIVSAIVAFGTIIKTLQSLKGAHH